MYNRTTTVPLSNQAPPRATISGRIPQDRTAQRAATCEASIRRGGCFASSLGFIHSFRRFTPGGRERNKSRRLRIDDVDGGGPPITSVGPGPWVPLRVSRWGCPVL
ncbi:hypothetical protein NL676_025304 [Syzygium grande]|nr:hypothetical protein NL676_025304 [Syzygium grande]